MNKSGWEVDEADRLIFNLNEQTRIHLFGLNSIWVSHFGGDVQAGLLIDQDKFEEAIIGLSDQDRLIRLTEKIQTELKDRSQKTNRLTQADILGGAVP